jgi:hypothetical protein
MRTRGTLLSAAALLLLFQHSSAARRGGFRRRQQLPVSVLCFTFQAAEWCDDADGSRQSPPQATALPSSRSSSGEALRARVATLRQRLRQHLPGLAGIDPSLLTMVREGVHGPLYPLGLLVAAPDVFTSRGTRRTQAGTQAVADPHPTWVVVVSARPDEPFANHTQSSSAAVDLRSLLHSTSSNKNQDGAGALLAQMQRHGWARLRLPSAQAQVGDLSDCAVCATVVVSTDFHPWNRLSPMDVPSPLHGLWRPQVIRALTRTARRFFARPTHEKLRASMRCPYTGKHWGWARQAGATVGEGLGEMEFFMVRREVESFTAQLPWEHTPSRGSRSMRAQARAVFDLMENVCALAVPRTLLVTEKVACGMFVYAGTNVHACKSIAQVSATCVAALETALGVGSGKLSGCLAASPENNPLSESYYRLYAHL